MTRIFTVISLLTFAFVAMASNALAAGGKSFTLTDDVTREVYTCTTGGNAGGGPAADPECISQVSNNCRAGSNLGSNECFKLAVQGCRYAPVGYADCVNRTANNCRAGTNLGSNECYKAAIDACRS